MVYIVLKKPIFITCLDSFQNTAVSKVKFSV